MNLRKDKERKEKGKVKVSCLFLSCSRGEGKCNFPLLQEREEVQEH